MDGFVCAERVRQAFGEVCEGGAGLLGNAPGCRECADPHTAWGLSDKLESRRHIAPQLCRGVRRLQLGSDAGSAAQCIDGWSAGREVSGKHVESFDHAGTASCGGCLSSVLRSLEQGENADDGDCSNGEEDLRTERQ
jgi:hypothetical protein